MMLNRAFLPIALFTTALLAQLPAQAQTLIYRNSTFVGVEPDRSVTPTYQQSYPVDSTYSTYSSYPVYSSYPTYSTYASPTYAAPSYVIRNTVRDSTLVRPVIVNPTIRNSTLVNPVIVSPPQNVIRQPVSGEQTNPACMAFSSMRVACH